MMKINNIIKTAAFIFAIAVIGMPNFASAQTAAPGTSSGGATVNDVLNQAQKNETNRIESSKGQDSGENYGVGDAFLSAAGDAAQDVAENAQETWDDMKKGNIGRAFLGILKTGASAALGSLKTAYNFFSNMDMLGQDMYVYTDPYTGKEKKYVKTLFGGAVATEGNLKGCPPIPIAIADASSCTFCPLFAVIYGAAQEMTALSFEKLAKPIASALLAGFAIYIAFKVLAQVSAFTRQDAPSFINELLIQTFKVLLAFLFLMNPNQIYYYFISPVLGAGLEFGTAMLFQASDMAQQCLNLSVENDTALLPVTLYAKLDCYVRSVQTEIAVTQAVGSSLMCAGRHAAAGSIAGFWDFNMVFQGLFIWAFAIMLSLAFAFYLVDAIVTLGIVGALMPFLIACWPFKITNKYSKTGLDMFLNVFFTFVFMGIVVSINTQLIGQAMNGGTGTTTSSSSDSGSSTSGSSTAGSSTAGSSTAGSSTSGTTSGGSTSGVPTSSTSGGLGALAEALSGDNLKAVRDMTDLGFGGFLILVFCCIFGFKFSNQSSTLANKMAGGAGLGIAANIGGMAAKGAKDLGAKATKPMRKAAANKANELTSKAGNAVAAKLGLGKFGGKTGANKGGSNSGDGGKGGNGGNGGGNGQDRQSPTGSGDNRNNLHEERNPGGGNGGDNGGGDNGGGNGGGDNGGGNGGDNGGGNGGGNGNTQTQSSGPTGAGGNGGGDNGGGNGGDTGGNGGNGNSNGNGSGGAGGNS